MLASLKKASPVCWRTARHSSTLERSIYETKDCKHGGRLVSCRSELDGAGTATSDTNRPTPDGGRRLKSRGKSTGSYWISSVSPSIRGQNFGRPMRALSLSTILRGHVSNFRRFEILETESIARGNTQDVTRMRGLRVGSLLAESYRRFRLNTKMRQNNRSNFSPTHMVLRRAPAPPRFRTATELLLRPLRLSGKCRTAPTLLQWRRSTITLATFATHC